MRSIWKEPFEVGPHPGARAQLHKHQGSFQLKLNVEAFWAHEQRVLYINGLLGLSAGLLLPALKPFAGLSHLEVLSERFGTDASIIRHVQAHLDAYAAEVNATMAKQNTPFICMYCEEDGRERPLEEVLVAFSLTPAMPKGWVWATDLRGPRIFLCPRHADNAPDNLHPFSLKENFDEKRRKLLEAEQAEVLRVFGP